MRGSLPVRSFILPVAVFNAAAAMFVAAPMLSAATSGSRAADLMVHVSHCSMLAAIAALALWAISRVLDRKAGLAVSVIVFSVLLTWLYYDTAAYAMVGEHLSAGLWKEINQRGAVEALPVMHGRGTVIALMVAMEAALGLFVLVHEKYLMRWAMLIMQRASLVLAVVLAAVFVIEKVSMAYAGFTNNTPRIEFAGNYAYYARIPGFGGSGGGGGSESGPLEVRYPARPLICAGAPGSGLNVIVIVLRGLRYDMLTPAYMPNTASLIPSSIVYDNHESGGIEPRAGMFSILYGLPASYWNAFHATNTPPVLIETALRQNYDVVVLSGRALTAPDIKGMAFHDIVDRVLDHVPTNREHMADRIVTEELVKRLNLGGAAPRSRRPLMALLYLHSTGGRYDYPSTAGEHSPAWDPEVESNPSPADAEAVRNRYMNALAYADTMIGQVIDALRSAGALDHTVLIITGDHGEELFERGRLGHGSSFNGYQSRTALLMRFPGQGPRTEHRLTSGMDIVPTIVYDVLACGPDARDYSAGVSLLDAGAKRGFVPVADRKSVALVDDDNAIVMPAHGGWPAVLTRMDATPVADPGGVLKQKAEHMREYYAMRAAFVREGK